MGLLVSRGARHRDNIYPSRVVIWVMSCLLVHSWPSFSEVSFERIWVKLTGLCPIHKCHTNAVNYCRVGETPIIDTERCRNRRSSDSQQHMWTCLVRILQNTDGNRLEFLPSYVEQNGLSEHPCSSLRSLGQRERTVGELTSGRRIRIKSTETVQTQISSSLFCHMKVPLV
jgi:hypothetical protein